MHELKNFNDQLFKNVISNPTEQELRNLAKPMEYISKEYARIAYMWNNTYNHHQILKIQIF